MGHKPNLLPQLISLNLLYVFAVDQYGPLVEVVKSEQQTYDGRLARPRRSNQGYRLPVTDFEADLFEYFNCGLAGVAKRSLFELDDGMIILLQVWLEDARGHFHGLIHDLENVFADSQSRDCLVDDA